MPTDLTPNALALFNYMPTAQSGDWLMCRWTKPSWFNRATVDITGAVHHHDELVICYNGRVYVGNAVLPQFQLKALEERIAEVHNGGLTCAVYRRDMPDSERRTVRDAIRAWDAIPPRYDVRGVLSIARSWLRAKLPIPLKPILKHSEHAVYCTENCFCAMGLADESPSAAIGYQPLPSPIHAERLTWIGDNSKTPEAWMSIVCDAGLAEDVAANYAAYAKRKEGAR